MKWQFRFTQPSEGPAIAAFLAGIFHMPLDHPGLEARQMHWKYWEGWSDWDGARSYVLTKDEEIVAHGAVVPLVLAAADSRVRVVRIIDWASNPRAVGSGVALMKHVGELADAVMAVGGTVSTRKVFQALRATHYGDACGWVRPLRPFRRFLHEGRKDFRAAARLARGIGWSVKAPSAVPAGWSSRRIMPGTVAAAAIPRPVPEPGKLVFERSTASLEYYLKCPAVPMELYAVSQHQTVCGYFLLGFAGAQARLVESWVSSGDSADWRALHLLAVQEARKHSETVEFFTMSSASATGESLAQTGFHRRDSSALLLVDYSKKGLPDGLMRVQMLEGDAAYLYDGTSSFAA